MSTTLPAVGCIGAGVLGAAIMRRLVDRHFPVTVWNRDPAKLAPLLDAGATAATSPAELTRSSEFVITCIADERAVESVVFGEHGVAGAGDATRTFIDMSTASAPATREMAARLRARCAMPWLDAPISGGAPAALAGTMAVMVGGETAVFERARPLWDALAGRCTLMGPVGAGQTTKMINQVLVANSFTILGEACALAERAGVDPALIPQAIAGGRADSRLAAEMLPRMAASDFEVQGRIALMLKDLELIGELARVSGATTPLTGLVTQVYRKLVADGLGERDNCEMVRFFRSPES